MSYFAHIKNGIVDKVVSAEQDIIDSAILGDPKEWIKTSYNTKNGIHYGQDGNPDGGVALRGNYAGIGYIYDEINDVFYSPQPYPSWTILAPEWAWKPPIEKPEIPENVSNCEYIFYWIELEKTWYFLAKPFDINQPDILYKWDNKWNIVLENIENNYFLWNEINKDWNKIE